MADVTVDRAVYKLVGDGSSYEKMLKDAEKSTKDFTKQTEKLSSGMEDLNKMGENVGLWKDNAKLTAFTGKVKDLKTNFSELTEVLAKKPTKEAGIAGAFSMVTDTSTNAIDSIDKMKTTFTSLNTTVTAGITLIKTGAVSAFASLTSTLKGATTAAGAFSLALKAIPFVAVAAAAVYVVKELYNHSKALEKLDKELEESKEANDAWVASFRAATDVIIQQSQIIPGAADRIALLSKEFSNADKEWNKFNKTLKVFEEAKEGLGVPKGQQWIPFASFFNQPIPDFEDDRIAYEKELDALIKDVTERRAAASARMVKIADEMKDSAGKIQTAIRTAFSRETLGIMTVGMDAFQKESFVFEQQLEFLKRSSELMEEAGDTDLADDIWIAFKQSKRLFEAFKEAAAEGAIVKVREDIKSFKKELQESIDTMGMSADRMRRWKMEQEMMRQGIIPSKTQLDRLDEVIKKKEHAFANKRLIDEGKALNKQFLTEEMKMADEMMHLEDLFKGGYITEGTYLRALEAIEKKYNDVADAAHEMTDAIRGINASVFGSSEAIAKMMAQQESFRTPWGEKQRNWETALARERYSVMGPFDDPEYADFVKRNMLMGPKRGRADIFDPEIDAVNEAERRKIREEKARGRQKDAETEEKIRKRAEEIQAAWEAKWGGPPVVAAGGGDNRAFGEGINKIVNAVMAVVTAVKENPQIKIEEADIGGAGW